MTIIDIPREMGWRDEFSPFDKCKQMREDGSEFWLARALMLLLGYANWQNFERAIKDAMKASANMNVQVEPNFIETSKVSGRRGPAQKDYELSRFACYLIAMNGDPNKNEVAAAQGYFVTQTYFAEKVQQGAITTSVPTEDAISTKFDKTMIEFQRVITPANADSPTAAALASVLQNLSLAMVPVSGSTPSVKGKKSKALPACKPPTIPSEPAPFVSQAGKPVSRGPRAESIAIAPEAENPVTYREFAKLAGLDPCGRCGQALSHRMTGVAERTGKARGRERLKNIFEYDFWFESWVAFSEHLEKLHQDHARNHSEVSNG